MKELHAYKNFIITLYNGRYLAITLSGFIVENEESYQALKIAIDERKKDE